MSFPVYFYKEGNLETFEQTGNMERNIMETTGLKALAHKVLMGNSQGNFRETPSFLDRKPEAVKVSIMDYEGGIQAEDYDNLCVKPLPLIYAEPCGKHTPPHGDCISFKGKLHPDTRSLKPWCLARKAWCSQ